MDGLIPLNAFLSFPRCVRRLSCGTGIESFFNTRFTTLSTSNYGPEGQWLYDYRAFAVFDNRLRLKGARF